MDIYLKKEIIYDKQILDCGLLSYIALRIIKCHNPDNAYVSSKMLEIALLDDAYGKYYSAIMTGIYALELFNIVEIKKRLSDEELIVDISGIEFKNEFFIKVSHDDIKKILSSPGRCDNLIKTLRYFLCMIGSLNLSQSMGKYQGIVGTLPMSAIASYADVSVPSAIRYNRFLLDNKLIYVYHSKNKTNTYSRYSDKKLCIEYGKERI